MRFLESGFKGMIEGIAFAAVMFAIVIGFGVPTSAMCGDIALFTPDYTESAVYEKHCEGGE